MKIHNKCIKAFGILLVVGLLFAVAPTGQAQAQGTTRYVDPDGNCGGQTPCHTTIQAAIDAVGDGETVIELMKDATLDYGAREAYGTESTTKVTINGNGKTLTLHQTNTDWSSIGLKNTAATFALENVNVVKTTAGGNGAWNNHALQFASNVELTDTTFDNAILLGADAQLNDVTITEAGEYYGIWIEANGQTVTIKDTTVTAPNSGRGIKISDQYVGEPELVTLSVSGSAFNTAKKAAIIVGSTAGATITIEEIDIRNVAADTINAVWVDEEWANYQDLVTVEGGSKVLENAVAVIDDTGYLTIQAAIDAASAYDTINVAAGTYAELLTITKPLTLLGPNADIDGTTGTRTDEAIITFPEGDNSGWSIIDAESNDITVNGFTFKNDQIINSASGGWDLILVGENIEFINNRVISQAQQKIAFKIQGPFTNASDPDNDYAGAIVRYNYFESPNTSWNAVIIQGIGATVQYNTIIGGASGIQIQPYTNTAGGTVSHNNIVGYFHAIWHNYQTGGNGLWIYEDNILGALTPTPDSYRYGVCGFWRGVEVQTHTPNIEVKLNTINGEKADYTLAEGGLCERIAIGARYYSGLYSDSQINVHDNNFVNLDQNVENQEPALGDLDTVFANNTFENAAYIENSYLIYTSIQDAIDAAKDGDTILVGPGTYNENITINKANITLQSTGTAEETIINADKGFGVYILKDLGTVTIDGFTVKGWETAGIVQGTANRPGTTSRILNNIVVGETGDVNHGNCIQVTGDDSLVQGNTVTGAYYIGSGPYGASGILVYLANNAIVRNNVVTNADIGIAVTGGGAYGQSSMTGALVIDNEVSLSEIGIGVSFDANNTTIEDNFVHDNSLGLLEEYNWGYGPTGTVALHNKIVDNTEQALTESYDEETPIPSGHIFMAEANWWGSVAGPGEAEINEYVDYAPWCGDAECSFLVYPLEGEITETQTIVGTGTEPLVYLLKDGTKINPSTGPCFDIQRSYVTIMTESPAGAVCYPGSPGIQVYSGATNVVIEGLEIDGLGTAVGNGIDFLGAATDVIISDTYIHDMVGDGVHFAAQPGGYVEIKGNLFMDNTGEGVDNSAGSSAIDATYNAWGDYDGPTDTTDSGDGVSTFVTYDPWTHVDVYVADGVGTRYLNEVALGDDPAEEITYSVYANLKNAHGAQFTLTYDPTKLQVSSTSTVGTVFPYEWTDGETETVAPGVDASVPGKITFAGGAITAVSGEDQFLFSVTFTGVVATDAPNPFFFDEADEDWYGMNPLYGSSLNIYAAGMVGIADVNVYDLPTLAIDPLETFAVGNAKEFTLTVTNPVTGRDYTDLDIDLLGLGGTLEYWDGTAWVTYTQGDEIPVGALAIDSIATVDFRIIFTDTTNVTATVNLEDDAILLVTNTFEFAVRDAFTVTGTVQMQGRTERAGVLIELAHNTLPYYMYDTLSTNIITDNYTLLNIAEGTYTIKITHDRYLDFVFTTYSTADLDLTRLELRGGDVQKDNLIDIFDASLVGLNYGAAGNDAADANFDGTVNIQDLAMIGGNFDLQSTDSLAANYAYGTWLP